MSRLFPALAASCALSLAGCASGDRDTPPGPPPPPPPAGGTCDADGLQDVVGQQATAAIGQRILERSGARVLRWGPPNSAWTMDYRQDRVNVRYDESSTITEITCG